ncbi:MAG TPA: phenylalanine--tRNA ligase subunit beta [Gaiellales bacterium]
MSWLQDHLEGELPPFAEFRTRITLAGVEIEKVTTRGVSDEGHVVAGLVLEAIPHPNADRLQLCQVDTGGPEPRQIVCGAWNFGAGDTVAVALPGLRMPDGRKIERSKLRGSVSDGMILSERELEISDEHGGILVLGNRFVPGEPLATFSDTVLDFEILANRSDLLSVRGVARDVAAVFGLGLRPLDEAEPEATGATRTADLISIHVDERALCPRFTARVLQGVQVAPSPLWLKARLSAAGIRPISNVVDVTNYVAHDLGQPLHAYDLARIPGRTLIARRAHPGERLTTLDDRERTLDADTLVIAHGDGPSGIAGVMGGADSEITDDATEVVLEAASFERVSVLRTMQRLGMRTEASNRFQKGVDPHLAPIANRLAARMIVELAGATLAPDPIDVHGELPEPGWITLRAGRVEAVIGVAVETAEAKTILERLGFEVKDSGEDLVVRPPTWRILDVTREIDVVEEVARIHGLEHVPATLPSGARSGGLSPSQLIRRRLHQALLGAGSDEVQTLALVPAEGDGQVTLMNALSSEQAALRTTLLPSLATVVARNQSLGRSDVAIYEIAPVYLPREGQTLPDEPWTAAALIADDFSTAKGILETVLAAVGVELEVEPGVGRDPFLHPGRAARVRVGGHDIGYLGELHPSFAERLGMSGSVAAFEIDIRHLEQHVPGPAIAVPVPDTPPLRQDIAVVVSDDHLAGDVLACVREAGGPLLRSAAIFDVYRDRVQLGEGRRSLAIRLTFQADDRTLTDDEVAPLRTTILDELAARFEAVLR